MKTKSVIKQACEEIDLMEEFLKFVDKNHETFKKYNVEINLNQKKLI